MKFSASLILISGVLSGCAVLETTPRQRALQVLLTVDRGQQLEPCGCSLAPSGGVARLKSAMRAWISPETSRLSLHSGSLFFPKAARESKAAGVTLTKLEEEGLAKTAAAMRELGLMAAAPSAHDLRLGVDRLKHLAARGGFPLLAADIVDSATGEPVLDSVLKFSVDGGELLTIVGLSGSAGEKFLPASLRRLSPGDAVARALASRPGASPLMAILGNLSKRERAEITERFPKVALFLGGMDEERGHTIYNDREGRIYANPPEEGRTVARLEIEIAGAGKALFNVGDLEANLRELVYVEEALRAVSARRAGLEERRETLRRLTSRPPEAWEYTAEVITLDHRF